ncbi:unnamed protein product [Mytilus coruscus]|uniref:Uncharacterized protein n=1 Tax=Mytilus coruscus TaxID=42192 RepID=A0A6J8E1P1_MYTCO|nr:unnamed protein product [Mytilus coruscus]
MSKYYIDGQHAWSLNASTTSHSFSFVTSDSLDHPLLLFEGRYILTVVIEATEESDAVFELDCLELSCHETTTPQDLICLPNRKPVHVEIKEFSDDNKIVTFTTGTLAYSHDEQSADTSISGTFSIKRPSNVATLPPGFTSNGSVKKSNLTTFVLPENNIELSKGLHTMKVVVENSDVSGVNLDFISFTFNFGNNILQGIECLQHQSVLMEAEQFPLESTRGFRFRSNASSNRTVYMKQGDIIKRSVYVTSRVQVSMTTILFSNDGPADQISIKFQTIPMATLLTTVNSKNGTAWNNTERKKINSVLFLNEGEYELRVAASNTDKYGIEIDALILDIFTFDGLLTPC